MTLWLAVTPDQYELPMVVADTAKELSKLLGITENFVYQTLCWHNKGKIKEWKNYKIIKLDVSENE